MELVRRRLRRFSIAAFVALFGLALAPSISRAVTWAAGFDPMAEVCTSSGLASPASESGAGHLEHCALCALPGLLPAGAPSFAADVPAHTLARPAPRSATPALRPWAHAPPRAPPSRLC